ncbi:MAG TPA: hypothetical protein VGU01_13640 [Sphingomicrobium sp.]|nr:hypothetical protein [Sphingomicrobium sp.]
MEFDIKQHRASERRKRAEFVSMFERACEGGDINAFLHAVDGINEYGAWPKAFARISRLSSIQSAVKDEFMQVWVESKLMGLTAGDRKTLVHALRLLFPASACPTVPLQVYRGAGALERKRAAYGVCWTSDPSVARTFADEYQHWPSGSVILSAVVPPAGVIMIRDNVPGYYEESEVVVDPFMLENIRVIERRAPKPLVE